MTSIGPTFVDSVEQPPCPWNAVAVARPTAAAASGRIYLAFRDVDGDRDGVRDVVSVRVAVRAGVAVRVPVRVAEGVAEPDGDTHDAPPTRHRSVYAVGPPPSTPPTTA